MNLGNTEPALAGACFHVCPGSLTAESFYSRLCGCQLLPACLFVLAVLSSGFLSLKGVLVQGFASYLLFLASL